MQLTQSMYRQVVRASNGWYPHLFGGPIPVKSLRRVPTSTGIYIATSHDLRVRYVGQANRLRISSGVAARISSHPLTGKRRHWAFMWIVPLDPDTPAEVLNAI